MRSTATLLIAAFAVFLVGAGFWLVREFEQPLAARLHAVANRRRRWIWIHAWMFAGTLVSSAATASLVNVLRADEGGWPATAALALFTAGCLAFLVSLSISAIVTPAAAAETARTSTVPVAYLARHRLANVLYVAHMLLSYATFVLLGAAMLRGALVPAWVGWVGVVAGGAGLVGFPLLRGGPFAPPIIAHSFGLLVGIVLWVRL